MNLFYILISDDEFNTAVNRLIRVLDRPDYSTYINTLISLIFTFIISMIIVKKEINNQNKMTIIENNRSIKKEVFDSFVNFRMTYLNVYPDFFDALIRLDLELESYHESKSDRSVDFTHMLKNKIVLRESTTYLLSILENFRYDLENFLYYFEEKHEFYVLIEKYLNKLNRYVENVRTLNHQLEFFDSEALHSVIFERVEEQIIDFIEANEELHLKIERTFSYVKYKNQT